MVPVRLIISLAVIGMIAALAVAGCRTLTPTVESNTMQGWCDEASCEVTSLVRGGVARDVDDPLAAWGTRRVVSAELPDGCVYVSFGGDPDPDGDGVLSPVVLGSGAVIVYRMQGGGARYAWMPQGFPGFRAGVFQNGRWTVSSQSFIIHNNGRCRLVFELVEEFSIQYLLVYPG